MISMSNPAVPFGSKVLVTGANGFLGSHIADQFLRYGYDVRATVRNPSKEAWAVRALAVPEMQTEDAFSEAVRGIDVFAHSAAYMSFVNEADKVIPVTVAGALNALKAAYAEHSVKRFVLTSSSAAAVGLLDPQGTIVTEESWNEKAVDRSRSGPPYEATRPVTNYEASKTEAEKAIWKYHQEHQGERPDLVVNAVLPNFILGRSVDPVGQGYRSSSGLVVSLWNGEVTPFHDAIPSQYYVDVEDTALLHVAAALLPHVHDQRIFAFAGVFNWNKILKILRSLEPARKIPDDFSGGDDMNVIEPRDKAEALLVELGRPGWKSLAETVKENVENA